MLEDVSREQQVALAALAGGFMVLFYVFYEVRQIAYYLGVYSGAVLTLGIYNITAPGSALTIGAQAKSLNLALYITYMMLPFAMGIFALSVLWLFSRAYARSSAVAMSIASVVLMAATALPLLNLDFQVPPYMLAILYLGSTLSLASGIYSFVRLSHLGRRPQKRASHQIAINPDTPYSNMLNLSSRMMARLSGEVRILDMHFDVNGLHNLKRLVERNVDRYTRIVVLAKADRLGKEFAKDYSDFRSEMLGRNVDFELRVMDSDAAAGQHERIIMDATIAYKIPPLNIINRKSEHVVSIRHQDAAARIDRLMASSVKFENAGRA